MLLARVPISTGVLSVIKSLRLQNFKAFEDTGTLETEANYRTCRTKQRGEEFDSSKLIASETDAGRSPGDKP